jgi:lipocalin-like protein
MIKKYAVILFALAAFEGAAWAQNANPLVGAWTLVSVNDERPDGSKTPLYGSDPSGFLVFDAQGQYSLQLCAAGRPKYASNDRTKGTPEEYKAVAVGCNPHWGRYVLDAANNAIVFKIDHAMFPNWENTEQRRSFEIKNGVLSYSVPNAPVAGAKPVVTWKRAQ